MDEAKPDTPEMSPDEIVQRYLYLGHREQVLLKTLEETTRRLAALNKLKSQSQAERHEVTTERATLANTFREQTGVELKLRIKRPTWAEVLRTHHALLHALCEPANLEPTDPIVLRRLAEHKEARRAHTEWLASRKQQEDAEATEEIEDAEAAAVA